MKEERQIEVLTFTGRESDLKVKVLYREDTVWLTQKEMAGLFGVERTVVSKHLKNIFNSKELEKNSVCAIFTHTARDGKKYEVSYYNLDAIISVGYRVNSRRATQFRIWATKTLRDHVLRGYTLNEAKLLQAREKFTELQAAVSLLLDKTHSPQLSNHTSEILELLSAYAKTLTLLEGYDSQRLITPKGNSADFILTYEHAALLIHDLKAELLKKGEASRYFAQDPEHKLAAITGNIYQTFKGNDLYPTIESKAAHLLYFVIKDHPFIDGNKRSGAMLFVYFLNRSGRLYKQNGERKINDNALTALTLLTAISDPKEKETIIKIILNLIAE